MDGSQESDLRKKRTTIRTAYCLSLVQWTSLAVEMSVLPFIGKDLGIADVNYGYLSTVGAFCQLITSPIYSHWAGTNLRKAITVAFVSASVSYSLAALANGFWFLFVSRITSLFASHSAVAAQAAVTASTQPEERTAYFGRLGATVGAGFMIGSVLGGTIARTVGLRFPLYCVSAVCAVAAVIGPMFVRQVAQKEKTIHEKEDDENNKGVKGYVRLLSSKRVSTILLAKNFVFAPMILGMTIMGMYMIEKFNIDPGRNSMLTLLLGVCMMAMNAGGVAFMKRYLSDRSLLYAGVIAFALNGLGMNLASTHGHFFLIMPVQAAGISLVAASTDSMLTSSVRDKDHALVVSLAWAVDAMVRVVGPVIAGLMLTRLGFASFGYTNVIGAIAAICLVYMVLDEEKTEKHK